MSTSFEQPDSGEQARAELPPDAAVSRMPTPESPENYRERTAAVMDSSSFEELYGALREIGTIKGKDAEAVIDKIKGISEDQKNIDLMKQGAADLILSSITREYGLRPKVRELLRKDHPDLNI